MEKRKNTQLNKSKQLMLSGDRKLFTASYPILCRLLQYSARKRGRPIV